MGEDMFIEKKHKSFANGCVYALETADGYPIEVTDTFLPFYTKDAKSTHGNELRSGELGSRAERWMVGVSTMSGCPVGCKFCATGKLKKWRNLSWSEIMEQLDFIFKKQTIDGIPYEVFPQNCKEFKINYTRMGEPFLNILNVRLAIAKIDNNLQDENRKNFVHHYVSTVGIKGSDFSWIKDNITLQISLHSLDEDRRKWLIPNANLMTIEELGQIRTDSKQKTTVNLTLVDEADFDIEKLKKYFDPKYFFIKLSPINKNDISEKNGLGDGIIEGRNMI